MIMMQSFPIRPQHARRAALFFLACIAAAANPALAQDGLSSFWDGLDNYDVKRTSSTPYQPQQAASLLGIPPGVLEEYTIKGQSQWVFQAESEGSNGSAAVRADAFQMLDPPGAFGLLTHWGLRSSAGEARSLSLPVDNLFDGRQLVFCKGSYFVRLRAATEGQDDESILSSLAARLAEAIQEEDISPVTVLYLPRQGLVSGSVRFYQGPEGLLRDSDFPEALLPLIEFRKGVELTTARYESGERLFLAGYPTPALASQAEQRLQASDALSQLRLKRSIVLVAMATASHGQAAELLEGVKYDPKVQWIKDKVITLQSEALILYQVLTGWVFFSLFYIGSILVFGVMVGLGRYIIHRRYPVFAARDEMVRLKLADK